MHLNLWDAGAAMQFLVTITEATGFKSIGIKPCSQQTNWTELNSRHSNGSVHSKRTELNWPAPSWPSYTTRYWSRASRSWLAAGLQPVVRAVRRALQFSSVQFVCCEHCLNTALANSKKYSSRYPLFPYKIYTSAVTEQWRSVWKRLRYC